MYKTAHLWLASHGFVYILSQSEKPQVSIDLSCRLLSAISIMLLFRLVSAMDLADDIRAQEEIATAKQVEN